MDDETPEQIAKRLYGCDVFIGTLTPTDEIVGRSGERYTAFRGDDIAQPYTE